MDDDFTSGMARAAAATALLAHELNNLDGQGRRVSSSNRDASNSIRDVSSSANRAESSINQFSGRLGLLVKTAGALGPALAPIGAVGIAAVAGLANQLGAVALAGGTAVLAFQGVGDTLKAVDKAAIQPTAANIEAARIKLEQLSPAAQELVMRLEDLKPALADLKTAAADGLMPGVLDSINELETRLPDVQRILESVSLATGHLVADAGKSLAGSGWDDFFNFLATEVPGTLIAVGKSIGSLTHGLAEMWMAFSPLNTDFSNWMVDAADSFDKFASGLADTQGFSDFIAYVRENGPQVAETAGAIANALVQIAEAAAPIGGPVLKGVESLANILANLADSDLGTPIMAAVAAMSALSLATKAYGGIVGTSLGGKAKSSILGMTDALLTVTSAQDRARMSVAQWTEAETKRSAAIRSGVSTLGRAAAGIGAVALVTSGVADKMDQANTATLGLAGAMGGPLGAAAGAAIGFGIDLAKANNDFADAMERANRVLADSPADFAAQQSAIEASIAAYNDFYEAANPQGGFFSGVKDALTLNTASIKNGIEDIFGTSEIEDQQKALADWQKQQDQVVVTWRNLQSALGNASGLDKGTASLEDLKGMADHLKPTMDALGISFQDLQNADPTTLQAYADAMRDYNSVADSTPGRTVEFVKSLNGLDDEMLSTADSAGTLAAALDNLFGKKLNAEQATDAYVVALKEMQKTLAGNTKTFQGNSTAALENRDATRQALVSITEMLNARAANGAGAKEITRSLQESREAFIKDGIAAGFSRDQMVARAKAMGLTPKLVRTVFESQGLSLFQAKIRDVVDDLGKLPKDVRTTLKTEGYDLSKKQIADLTKKYDLTPKQVDTIMQAQDHASAVIKEIDRRAGDLNDKKVAPNIVAKDYASPVIARVSSSLNSLDGNSARVFVYTVHSDVYGGQAGAGGHEAPNQSSAAGNIIDYYGRGGLRENHVAQIARANTVRVWAEPETGGEAYIPLANDWRRNRAQEIWREAGRRIGMAWQEFAQGGLVGRPMRDSPVVNVAPAQVSLSALSERDLRALVGLMGNEVGGQVARAMKHNAQAATAASRMGVGP